MFQIESVLKSQKLKNQSLTKYAIFNYKIGKMFPSKLL